MAASSTYANSPIEDVKSRAKETIDNATDKVQSLASDAKDQFQAVGGNIKSAVDKSVKEQPLTTLVVAVAVGFVVGALWKS